MRNTFLLLIVLMICIFDRTDSLGNHIVGGELQMKSVGANQFQISLIQFWDKGNLTIPTATTGGNRDQFADLYIYSKRNNQLLDQVTVFYQSALSIEYQNRACATSRSLETLVGIYNGSIVLNPLKYNDTEGYYLVWERCCRNRDINNIVDPGSNGMVFYLEFPALTTVNSSPEFKIPNGQYICSNRDFTMNMSASDGDGDELRYSLVVPMRGTSSPGQTFGTNSSNGAYPLVEWESNISLNNVIPGPKPLSINQNGILKVTAGNIGLYVFTIQCEEFRSGKRIGLVRRDFQLLVIDCSTDTPEPPVVMFKTQKVSEVKFCPENPAVLETESAVEWSYQWQLNGLNIPGATSATIMVEDTGSYSVVKSFSKKCSRDTTSYLVHVTHADPVEAIISTDKNIVCKGDSTILLGNGGSLDSGLICSWKLDNVLLGSDAPILTVSKAGIYNLTVTNPDLGCTGSDSDTIFIEDISIYLPDQISIMEGASITLSPRVRPESLIYSYEWSPTYNLKIDSNKPAATVSPVKPTDYSLTVLSENGCSTNKTIHVNVIDKLQIPSAFSPNNDGHNDTFEIFNMKDQIENVVIYNRWGHVIFSSEGYSKPWDGTYQNTPVPAGNYPFKIKTSMTDYEGEILLLR